MHLRDAGYVEARPLTRTEAARLIREYHRNPSRQPAPSRQMAPPRQVAPVALESARSTKPSARPEIQALRSPIIAREISESTKLHAYRLRVAAENARRALTANPEAPNVKADVVSTSASRAEFWQDTCREVKEMHLGSVQVFELYQQYGCRFFAPSRAQVEEVLKALDGAMPVWDRDHLGLFYQTLELNFPDLVHRV